MTCFSYLSWYWPENTPSLRCDLPFLLFDYHYRVFIKANIRSILPTEWCLLTHYEPQEYSLFLYLFTRFSFLDRKDNQLANPSISFFRTTKYFENTADLGTTIVSYFY